MKFNSIEYLNTWATSGRYPAIHDAIVFSSQAIQSRRILDLGCCFGLLGQRLKSVEGFEHVVGVDADLTAIKAAGAAGITIPLCNMSLTEGTLEAFCFLLKEHRVGAVVARRVLPEIFSECVEFALPAFLAIRAAGVEEWLIEGRVESSRSSNYLSSVQKEVDLMKDVYRPISVPVGSSSIFYLKGV